MLKIQVCVFVAISICVYPKCCSFTFMSSTESAAERACRDAVSRRLPAATHRDAAQTCRQHHSVEVRRLQQVSSV